jgi:NAD(P)-dependent dehydrogenase (short-subunit alcohol dehydrogenase family)
MTEAATEPPTAALQGRVILVTGAGDGLGRATALACARAGAAVVLLGRTVKKLEAVYDSIEQMGAPTPAIYPLHLGGASWNDYGELAATLEREYGRLDGIVHCAVHFKHFQPLDDIAPQDWFESLQVNLNGPYGLTRHCLPLLLKAQQARVVFVTDTPGRAPKAFAGAYGVAKAAIENLAAMWALELERHPQLRFHTFNPGPMKTGVRLRGYPGAAATSAPEPETSAIEIVRSLSS